MIIVMKRGATKDEVKNAIRSINELGYKEHVMEGVERTVIGAIGDERGKYMLESLVSLNGVESVTPILKPFKLASAEGRSEPSSLPMGEGVEIGG